MWRLGLFLAALPLAAISVVACDFQFEPASTPTYYRADGWMLPGTTDFNPNGKADTYGGPRVTKIPGEKVQLLAHDENPYVIEFPAQESMFGKVRMKLHSMQAKAVITRISIGGKVVAYSYGLIPVQARRDSGHWVIESEMACVFTVTFIDDKGDGVFRSLVRGPLTPDLVPRWAKPQENI
jgi:hypothetical protein